jgi:hypothetical protein
MEGGGTNPEIKAYDNANHSVQAIQLGAWSLELGEEIYRKARQALEPKEKHVGVLQEPVIYILCHPCLFVLWVIIYFVLVVVWLTC